MPLASSVWRFALVMVSGRWSSSSACCPMQQPLPGGLFLHACLPPAPHLAVIALLPGKAVLSSGNYLLGFLLVRHGLGWMVCVFLRMGSQPGGVHI